MVLTFIIDRQRLCDHTIKFAEWQHPALGRGRALPYLSSLVTSVHAADEAAHTVTF